MWIEGTLIGIWLILGHVTPLMTHIHLKRMLFYFLNLHSNHGFQWDIEIMGEEADVEGVPRIRLTGWADEDIDNV